MNQEIANNTRSAIKALYELEDGGQYEIVKRSMFIIDNALLLGKTSKECVDRLMDMGVKHTELGIAVCVSLSRADPTTLCEDDLELQSTFSVTHKDLVDDSNKLEEQSGDKQ